ncbi:hypothetical protein A8F94_01385 [Bacillus sp. FJAT-27225]|uniref:hypothetical protein n=1 Tax=Bacillus sp. FJAT-27225 TaxID=1743144 RepID=UPI00080C225E|nr:hypothetical protein [Bacillus sp. FJAT-27225]OCA90563.1 hypothetical protein A8F94_01385 [Bacillus sp. FJAT-27225]
MDFSKEMALELENMIRAGEVDHDIADDISAAVLGLRNGTKFLDDFYRASTPHKVLEVFDEVSQRVKR